MFYDLEVIVTPELVEAFDNLFQIRLVLTYFLGIIIFAFALFFVKFVFWDIFIKNA